MTIFANVKQLVRHITTDQEMKEVKKNVAFLKMGFTGNAKR